MLPDTITLAIEEKYTPEEKAEIAGKLACAIADLETIRGEKKVSDAAFSERIKSKDAEITEFAKRYNKGCEVAQIGCDIRYNSPEPGKKSYFRMDRNELVETHDMNWEEKQGELQLNLPPVEATSESGDPAEPEGTPTASELAKALGDVTPCEHPAVSGEGDTWTCDSCGEILSEPPSKTAPPLRILPDERPQPGAGA